MTKADKTLILIHDAMSKRPIKIKSSLRSSSETPEKGNKQISFSKFYKQKLMKKLNEKRD